MQDILATLVSYPTVTTDHTANDEALSYIAATLRQYGLRPELMRHQMHQTLYASTRGTKTPKVLLCAHLDVVPAPDTMFKLRHDKANMYGRGVLDMKFAIASYIQTMADLKDQLTAYDIGIMITTDEESGGQYGVGEMVRAGYLPQVCLLPDGGDDWQVQVYSKGFMRLDLTAIGTPAHASRPWLGKNAIDTLMAALADIHQLFPEPMHADSNTLNLGLIRGGSTHNQVAESAAAGLDIRFVSADEQRRLLQAIDAIARRHDVAMELMLEGPVTEFSLADPLIAPFVTAIESVVDVRVVGSRTMGSNDARFFAEHGIPCISLYPTGGGHHGPDEWLDRQAFQQFHQVVRHYLDQVARD